MTASIVEADSDYNSYIDISSIILLNTKRKIKSYGLFDMNDRRRSRNLIREDCSYDNISNALKRSKPCSDFASFNLLSNNQDDTTLNIMPEQYQDDLKNDVKMISDMFKCISIPSSTC